MQQLEIQNVKIDVKTLPIILKLVYNGVVIKEYVLNATRNKKGIYLNDK